MDKEICTVKTIDQLIKTLEEYKKKLGGNAAVVMSQDEEGNGYGDILMFEADTVDQFMEYCEDEYRQAGSENAAVDKDNINKNVLVIFPCM